MVPDTSVIMPLPFSTLDIKSVMLYNTTKYSFKLGSNLDEKLTAKWQRWQGYTGGCKNWEQYLENIPGIKSAMYDTAEPATHLCFEDETALTMFLLRWL